METVLEARNLTKRYKHTTALDNVSLSLKQGRIYGFVGNNGAGKTTLMRIITGLAFPTEGEIALFGESGQKALENQRSRIGALIESPVFYENMSAAANLKAQSIITRSGKQRDIRELLELLKIGKVDAGKKTLRNFSTGMKQRYGIASALLGDPEFLVLDEPINGVDPGGVRELRDLFLSLNREQGKTILISSHILGELYRIATDFIFIHKGKIIQEITHEELEGRIKGGGTEYLEDYFLDLAAKAEAAR